jgi:hypothetical protein
LLALLEERHGSGCVGFHARAKVRFQPRRPRHITGTLSLKPRRVRWILPLRSLRSTEPHNHILPKFITAFLNVACKSQEAMNPALPAKLQLSLSRHELYPLNLWNAHHRPQSERYKRKINAEAERLCLKDESKVRVPIRDLFQNSRARDSEITSERQLIDLLEPSVPTAILSASADGESTDKVKCRFM